MSKSSYNRLNSLFTEPLITSKRSTYDLCRNFTQGYNTLYHDIISKSRQTLKLISQIVKNQEKIFGAKIARLYLWLYSFSDFFP